MQGGMALTCQVCGRQPAAELKVRRHVGMLVMQRFVTARAWVCRDHGVLLAKTYLRKTLIEGWWGIISFFVNFYAVYTDVVALSTARKLAPPVAGPASGQPSTQTAVLGSPAIPPIPPPPAR
jgi:hypothetical protein